MKRFMQLFELVLLNYAQAAIVGHSQNRAACGSYVFICKIFVAKSQLFMQAVLRFALLNAFVLAAQNWGTEIFSNRVMSG